MIAVNTVLHYRAAREYVNGIVLLEPLGYLLNVGA